VEYGAFVAPGTGSAVVEATRGWCRSDRDQVRCLVDVPGSFRPVCGTLRPKAARSSWQALPYLLGDRRDELNAVLSRHYGVDDENELRHLGDRLAYAMDEPRPPEYWDDDEPHIGSRMSGPDPFTIWVGDALVREGRIEEALHHYRSRSDESAYAMRQAVELLERTGRTEEAISWLGRELMSGNERALWIMAELRARTGLRPEAMRLRTYGVETDGRTAGPWEAEPPGRLSS
jgi:hypothetical protein